ncbi:MAG: hypothetical protein IKI37_02015, partial [Oscillospiraceae bacterium]|nr:hypothetical protein [Oscillospiraceae bacterium]
LLIFGILAGIIYFLLPRIREALFRKRLHTMPASKCASAVFQHMRLLMHLPESTTVQELAQESASFFHEAVLFDVLDVLLYHPSQQEEPSISLTESYQNWANARSQFLKEQAQKQKQQKNLKAKHA